jgi:DNA-binding beta-propeller fold protein YncE
MLGLRLTIALMLALALAGPAAPGDRAPLHADVLVRVDPGTNRVGRVLDVGPGPAAVAVGGHSVWVYSDSSRTVSEIDVATARLRRAIVVGSRPLDPGYEAGPVLAADTGGAWLAGLDRREGFLLTRVPTGHGAIRTYALNVEPRAVAVGAGAVWVLGHRPGDNEVLRINKATGAVTGRAWFPDAGRVDGLAVGLGGVFVTFSRSATVYRVDASTMEIGPHVDLGLRAGRPKVRFGAVWVEVSDDGGKTLLLDDRTLRTRLALKCCTLETGDDSADGFGAVWVTDRRTGTLVRRDTQTYEPVATIRLTSPPGADGPCETAVTAGAGAVWVTLGPSPKDGCGVTRAGG